MLGLGYRSYVKSTTAGPYGHEEGVPYEHVPRGGRGGAASMSVAGPYGAPPGHLSGAQRSHQSAMGAMGGYAPGGSMLYSPRGGGSGRRGHPPTGHAGGSQTVPSTPAGGATAMAAGRSSLLLQVGGRMTVCARWWWRGGGAGSLRRAVFLCVGRRWWCHFGRCTCLAYTTTTTTTKPPTPPHSLTAGTRRGAHRRAQARRPHGVPHRRAHVHDAPRPERRAPQRAAPQDPPHAAHTRRRRRQPQRPLAHLNRELDR